MDGFMNSFNASTSAFNRRENDIRGINEVGMENYNTKVANQKSNFTAVKGQVASANQAINTQSGIEEGFAGVGAEPLLKGGVDYGMKSLYSAGKAAKAARLGTRAQALAEGAEDAGENAGRGFTELAADGMDTELAQNAAAVLKAPGQALSKVGDVVGDASKAVGKAVYRGAQAIKSKVAPQFRNRGDATEQEGTELEPQQPTESSTTETSFGAEPTEAPRGNMPQESLARNTTTETSVEDLPAQGGVRSGQNVETRTLQDAGEGAEEQSETLVNAAGDEVGSAATGAGEGGTAAASAATGAGDAVASAAGDAAASAGVDAGAVAADAAAAGLDAAAAASEAIPGVGTVVGGLLAIGGGLAALFGGKHEQKKAPPPPPPPPKPKQMGINISESSPVMDSSIYRATGYNQMA